MYDPHGMNEKTLRAIEADSSEHQASKQHHSEAAVADHP
jgi:hypothetical protein